MSTTTCIHDAETLAKLAELQALREELARVENLNAIHAAKRSIAMNEAALPHLGGISAQHARKRIADARDELQTREYLAALEADRETTTSVSEA